ncbi:MAG: hypothetical protein ACTSVR_05455 [Candidatus Thorarchaeota archaeon]
MNNIYKTFESKSHKLEIMIDEHCESPRTSQDNLGTFIMWHTRYGYSELKSDLTPDQYLKELPEGTFVMEVYMYDHSGITFSTSPFSCRWDSGQVGYIYVTPDTLQREYPEITTEAAKEQARMVLINEIEELARYAEGMCYGFRLIEYQHCAHCNHTAEVELENGYGIVTGSPERIILDEIDQEYRKGLEEVKE